MNKLLPSQRTPVVTLILLIAFLARAEEAVTALTGFDPVFLTQGTEIKGKAGVAAIHGRYRYLFTDTENQRKFEATPDRYGIQFDGYCMTMGPLSQRGAPDRWSVSGGYIYLFASEDCRDSFNADPDAYTDHADLPPRGNAVSHTHGRELIALALAGMGGVAEVDAIKNIRWAATTIYGQGGRKTEVHQVATVTLLDQIRLDYSYGDFRESHILANGQLVQVNARNEVTPLPADVYEFVRRRLYREPLALLRVRNEPGFIAVSGGKGEVAGQPVEWLIVGYAGATTRLGIDSGTGRILAAVYHGRAPSKLGEICKIYSNFETMKGGVILPQSWVVTYDGLPAPGPLPSTRSVSVNVTSGAANLP